MFQCEPCGYLTADRYDYNRHLLTKKHIKTTLYVKQSLPIYECPVCGKVYRSRAGLWKHRSNYNCVIGKPGNPGELETDFTQMETKKTADVILVLKEQIELQRIQNEQQQSQINQMVELLSKVINTNTSVTITNSNNTTNNVNVFLQQRKETAIDWMDFVDSLEVPMEITESSEEKYASVIIYNLNTLSPEEYPIYCRDKKRKKFIMMVGNEWQSGDETNIDSVFNKIHTGHVVNLDKLYKKTEVWDADKPQSHKYMKAFGSVMGGKNDEDIYRNKQHSINVLSDAVDIKDAMNKTVVS
jgi:uncharacterized Zn finger protein